MCQKKKVEEHLPSWKHRGCIYTSTGGQHKKKEIKAASNGIANMRKNITITI